MNIEESQRRFMESCEIEPPPTRRDWLETIALLVIGFAAGYVYSLI